MHLKTDKVDFKKSHREKKIFCINLQSTHQVDMKNVVDCPREFITYFNALETRGEIVAYEIQKRCSYQIQKANHFS